jgi:cytochrome P450
VSAEDSKCVIDFDPYSSEYAACAQAQDERFRREMPVAWSDHYGGFWLVTSYELATAVLRDWETYSTLKWRDENGETHGGVAIPPIPEITTLPNEIDPPLWNSYRKPVAPLFAPSAIERLRTRIDLMTTEFIDRVIESGEADLVNDVAAPVPAMIILEILELPLEDWRLYAEPFHEIVYAPEGTPEYAHAQAGLAHAVEMLHELVTERRKTPGDGFVERLLEARLDGEPFDDDVIVGMCMDSIGGGVDTTTAMLANAFVHLDERPEERARLRDDPDLLVLGTEEFLRWVSPIRMLARTVTKDHELGGQQLRAGDRMLVSYSSANRDDTVFDDPDTVILDRFPNQHTAFGIGTHRCLGSNLARVVFRSVLTGVLTRMPDYRIDFDRAKQYDSMAMVNGWINMPARFTPGPTIGSGLDLKA